MRNWRFWSILFVILLVVAIGIIFVAIPFIKVATAATAEIRDMNNIERQKHSSNDNQSSPSAPVENHCQKPADEFTNQKNVSVADLERVRSDQAAKLIKLGFHKAAGLGEKEFLALIPLPEATDALLVTNENFLTIREQCRLLNVGCQFDAEKHFNLTRSTKEKIYWRHGFDEGWATMGMSVQDTRKLSRDRGRLPATTVEVLAIYVQYPEVLQGMNLDAAGSGCGNGKVPYLCLNEERTLELGVALSNRGHRQWGSPSFRK